MSKKVIIYGSLAYDHHLHACTPLKQVCNEIQSDEVAIVPVETERMMFGGNGGNIAFYLAKMKCPPVLISSVGYDGAEYIARLQKLGIDTTFIQMQSDMPTTSVWLIKDASHSIAFFDDRTSQTRTWDLPHAIAPESIVHIAPGKPANTLVAIEKARGSSALVIWDPGQDLTYFQVSEIERCLKASSMLILNQHELGFLLTHCSLEKILQTTTLIETRGEEGVRIHQAEEDTILIPATPAAGVASSWGAGDAFRSGFLFGLQKGQSLSDSVTVGTIIASFAVEVPEAQRADITPELIATRLKDSGHVVI